MRLYRRNTTGPASDPASTDVPRSPSAWSASGRPRTGRALLVLPSRRVAAAAFAATLVALAAPGPGALAASPREPLKAVIIVGPSGSSTQKYLDRGEELADSAAAHGMDVVRIFHPRATWRRVRDRIQGANFVAFLGHGNGWPSPYAPFNPKTKDGFGLDPYEGASAYTTRYKGEDPIRRRVVLAPNAVVLLMNLCYASGNGEPHHAIPSTRVARQRADNYASGFLDAGASAVFAFGWRQEFDLVEKLVKTDQTMDEVFMTKTPGAHKYYTGFVGWDDDRYKSHRVAGARVHLDPHPRLGYYRSLTGDLSLTTGAWRGESDAAAGQAAGWQVAGLVVAGRGAGTAAIAVGRSRRRRASVLPAA